MSKPSNSENKWVRGYTDAIHYIDKDKKKATVISKSPLQQDVFYTIKGKEDRLDSDGNPVIDDHKSIWALARLKNGEKQSYYVKCDGRGFIFNPIGMYSEGTIGRKSRHEGREEFRFMHVRKKVFDFYLKFLQTKNKAWLTNAEREIL